MDFLFFSNLLSLIIAFTSSIVAFASSVSLVLGVFH